MEFETFALANGLRVVHRCIDRPVAHCGLFVGVGSRHEAETEQGLAHYLEHCLFKGTKSRKAYHVLSRMEDVGGELNAYTTKEETVIHCSFLDQFYPRAVELMADIVRNANFPAKEIEKEKEVVIDEINSYRDSPGESIFDDFEDLLFTGHALGRNILGTIESVKALKREHLLAFVQNHYAVDRMVFASVGRISSLKLKRILEQHLLELPAKAAPNEASKTWTYRAQEKRVKRTGYQSHLILGNRAYPAGGRSSRRLLLLNNLLGGPGMNSRLNLNIREKYGFTYHLESFYQPYRDTGLFGIYLGTDPGSVERSLHLTQKELRKLQDKELGTLQLSKAKRQLLGQIALAQENNLALMLALGKSYLHFDRIDTFADIRRQIESLTAEELRNTAQEIFTPEEMSLLIYDSQKPEDG